eukprot:gene28218-37130_t
MCDFVEPSAHDEELNWLNQWRSKGFALLDTVLPVDEIKAARDDLKTLISERPNSVTDDFGGFSFPFSKTSLNNIVLNKKILDIAKQALQGEVLLSQGEAWAKVAQGRSKFGNQDQRMHMDYPNHTLIHPPRWEEPNVIAMILYFDDVDNCGGATAVVQREGDDDPAYKPPYINMPGVGKHPWINDRETTEEYFRENDPTIYGFRQQLYSRERYVRYRPGTLLLYRHDLWHRGTPMKSDGVSVGGDGMRLVLNLVFKKLGEVWLTNWHRGWAYEAYDNLWGLMNELDEDQKAALGIPRELDPWWETDNHRENFNARYKDQNRKTIG